MGTKQRIIHRSEIQQKFDELQGKEMNLILKNGSSYFVVLISLKDGKIGVRNMFGHHLSFGLDEVEEVILEIRYA